METKDKGERKYAPETIMVRTVIDKREKIINNNTTAYDQRLIFYFSSVEYFTYVLPFSQ